MTYAIFADITSELKNLTLDADSALTDTEVTAFIDQEEAVINATISNRYETPITGAEALKVMKDIVITYVAYRVGTILNLKKDVPLPDKFVAQMLNIGSRFKIVKKQLDGIQAGKIILNDAVARSTGQGVESFNSTNNINSLWERDKKQW